MGVAQRAARPRIPEHESADHSVLEGVFLHFIASPRAGTQTSNHALQ